MKLMHALSLKKQRLSLMTGKNVRMLEKKLLVYLEKNMH